MKSGLFYPSLFLGTLLIGVWFQNCSAFMSPQENREEFNSNGFLSVSHPNATPITEKTSVGITLVDQLGVTSTLENIFQADSSSSSDRKAFIDLIRAEIRPQQHAFGRPCDIIATGNYSDCFYNLTNLEMGMWKSTSTIREASRIQLCRRLVANNSLLKTAVNQVTGKDLTPTEDSLKKAVKLFYPAWEDDSLGNVVQALVALDYKMAMNSEPISDRWRMVFVTICETPYWEIL